MAPRRAHQPGQRAPLCKPHNLFKQNHNFAITLEDDGHFNIWRPDGTELT